MNRLESGRFVDPAHPGRMVVSTCIIIVGSLLNYTLLPRTDVLGIFTACAVGMGVTLGLAVGIEGFGNLRRVLRVDIAALLALYFLTMAEFLAPNLLILFRTHIDAALEAVRALLIAFCCLAIGRHFPFKEKRRKGRPMENLPQVRDQTLFRILLLFAVLGYLYPLATVGFNPIKFFEILPQARWDRPWSRGQIGDWRSALTELQLLIYVVAALSGYIFARWRQFRGWQIGLVAGIAAFMLYFDFCEGTRTYFLIRATLLLATYFIAGDRRGDRRAVLMILAAAPVLILSSGAMLSFRQVGLKAFLAAKGSLVGGQQFMVDNNMYSLARVMDVFPAIYKRPGLEVLWTSLIKPIPRFLWPGKPVDWSTSIETALSARGYTIATTYVGEAYLTAGYLGIILISLLLGSGAATWNRVGVRARTNMDLVYYASGFFAALLGMRSMQWITVALVPTVAFFVFGRYILPRRRERQARRMMRSPLPVEAARSPPRSPLRAEI